MAAPSLKQAPYPWLSALLTPASAWKARLEGLPDAAELFVEPDPPPGRSQSVYGELLAEFTADPRHQAFLTGQRGAGKSQLVRGLEIALRREGTCEPIYVPMAGDIGVDLRDADIRDLLFFIARALAARAADRDPEARPLDLDEPQARAVAELSRLLVDWYNVDAPVLDQAGRASAEWYARLEEYIRLSPDFRAELHGRLRAEHVLALVRALLRKADGGKPIVLLIDDLDKLDVTPARRLLVEHASILARLPCGFLVTFPYGLAYEGGIARGRALTNVSVVHRSAPDRVLPTALDWFRRMLSPLMDPAWIEPATLKRLVWMSAGVPLELGQLLRPAVQAANARGSTRVEAVDLDDAVARRVPDLRRLVQEERRRGMLQHVRREKRLPEQDARLLLDLHLVFEYNNGEPDRLWYDVHPLLRDEVDRWLKDADAAARAPTGSGGRRPARAPKSRAP